MAPNQQVPKINRDESGEMRDLMTGDEVVISGMSGAFPKSENVIELMENLYNKVDMVEEVNCSTVKHPGLPKHYGKMKNLAKFDAQFFRVTPWQAASLDPLSRMVMENAFSAIYDAGVNPMSLSGTKLGVFIGSSFSDNVAMNLYDTMKRNAFVISGCSKTMMANRISYWIDAKGPSYGLDQACSSAMACLEIAYESMKRGDCDAALVGGCNTCAHPTLSLNLKIAGHLCMDGKTKSFDKNGDGYVRAEAISVLFLQKAKDAKRIYTEIYHIKGKYFTRPDANFLAIRNSDDVKQFLEEFYTEAKVSPSEVEYVEAFGVGIAEADANELDALGNFYAKTRPIKVGSIKSNMGNSEAANGACSLTKLCLAYQKGVLPANLHYDEPQTQIPAVRDGRIHVTTENTPFGGGWTALNSLSFTGCNYHVLLKGHHKDKDHNLYKSSIPRLVLISGRDERCVNKVIDELKSKPIDPEQIALLHNIYKINFPSHTGRGYTILDTNESDETISLAKSFQIYSGTTRPVCFLYSGMGSQWSCMGTELLRIPIFAAAIERCRRVLEPLGVDIVNILTNPDTSVFDNILNSMVGITAIQIGLTDILRAIGIIPNNIIGHSIGELGCAYADGCLTAEETILSSYSRGLISIETPFIRGSMAAIGLSYSNVLPLCPPEIEVACHNSAESATLSGPADIMKEFVSDLSKRGIFAREVACSNIPYHSKYIAEAGPILLSSMKKLVPNPKLRTEKWISTSVPQEKWDENEAKYASSEYFTNNLLSPVLFEENASLIPKDAIMIEIAPHGLLQAIVKKSHTECVNVSLTKRATPDPVSFLLQTVGKLYESGLNPSIDVLYPKVEFPVSTKTPLLSHLVEWDHSVDWPQFIHVNKQVKETSTRDFVISTHDDEYKFMKGFVRNGINEVPETALLVFIWETLAMYSGKYHADMSITFYDVIFHCHFKIDAEDVLRLRITIQDVSNRFEVFTGNTQIVSGFVKGFANVVHKKDSKNSSDDDVLISGKDFYTLLRMKGYSYGHDFKNVHSLNTTRGTAYIKRTGEWATFLDSLLQFNAFVRDHDGVSTPYIIKKLSINMDEHKNDETTLLENVEYHKAEIAERNTLVRCGGIELDGVIFSDKPKLDQQPDVLLTQEFVPHELEEAVNIQTATSINLEIVADNVKNNNIKVLELLNSSSKTLSNIIKEISVKFPFHHFDVNCVAVCNNIKIQDVTDVKLFIVHNFVENEKIQNILKPILTEDAFILTFESNITEIKTTNFKVITSMPVDGGLLALLKRGIDNDRDNVIYLPLLEDKYEDSKFSWITRALSELKKTRRVVLVAERQPYSGLLGIVQHLKKKGNNIAAVVVDDYHAASFDPKHPCYAKQLQKNLTFNVLQNGQWGSYYFVKNPKPIKIQNVSLTSTNVGDLDNLTWMDIPKKNENFVQKDAIMIEIAPHGLLQAIVKKSHTECVNVSLTKRATPDPVSFLLQTVGKLYESGLNPSIDVLYPKVEFPVSTKTPLLSHLVEWDHSVDWPQFIHVNKQVKETSTRDFVISTHDDEYKFMKGFVRNGINEVPETALLVFIWETLAMYSGKYHADMSITFYDVIFHCHFKIDAEDVLRLRITIQDVSNRFEVFTGNTQIVSGFVKGFANVVHKKDSKNSSDDDVLISGKDFYTLLRMKGYSYGHDFKNVHSLNTTRGTAYIKRTGEWATFLDSLLQFNAFVRDHDGVSTPYIIKKLSINMDEHKNDETTLLENVEYHKAEIAERNTLVRCGGIELDGVIFSDKPKLDQQPDVLLTQEFVPHELEEAVNIQTATSINLEIVADNVKNNNIKVLELLNSSSKTLSNIIKEISVKFPFHHFDVNCVAVCNNIKIQDVTDVKLFIVHNFVENEKIQNILKPILTEDAFILTFESNITEIKTTNFKVITSMPVDGGLLALLKRGIDNDRDNVIYLPLLEDKYEDSKFSWITRALSELKKTRRVVLVAERQPYSGLLGIVQHLKKKGNNIAAVVVDDYHAASFDPKHPCYAKQLQKNLTFNVLQNGQWGSYYFVKNPKPIKIQNVSLTSTNVGDLDNLTWMDIPKKNENFVQVSYAGLSARDCQKALGKTTNHYSTFGMDFSGVDSKGDQVMGLVANGALSSTVVVDPTLLWPVPKHWSLQDAATVPLPYIHAYYILVMKGEVRRQQRIFVTGGAGALGQAVISICHSLDCTVFTNVSDVKKKRFLMKLFPKLKDENISYSRHDSFFTKVKEVTKNQRCDIVINCSSGALREATMKCVGFLGKFIDVNNEDYLANKNLGMFYFEEDRQYKVVDLSSLFTPENISDRKALQILMAEGIANGAVRPLSRVVFSPVEVSRAFKLVSSSRHRGRALINMSDSKSLPSDVEVIQRMLFSKGVYIVVCDNNNLAVELIDHLIRIEAKNVIINMKKEYPTSYLFAKAASWKKFDVTVEVNSDDLQTKEGCERLLRAGQELGSVASIFIVQDYKEEVDENNIEPEAFQSSYNDTILVTANLDMMSRKMCSDLCNFVLISVASQNISSEYATSACQRICEARTKIGLPALVLRKNISNLIDQNESSLLSKLEVSSLSSLFNAMVSSLKLKHNNVTIYNFPRIPNISMGENLGRIFGVKHINEMDENLTLKDVNANDMVIKEIKSKLNPVTYSTDDLLDMTIACIKNLCYKAVQKKRTNFDVGIGAFYSHVENNEYEAVDAVVSMQTQQLSFEENGYIDRSDNHLMIIPGFDGRHKVFLPIAERLKIRAATLQLGPDLICDSIPEMARNLANHIKSHLEIYEKFYILGYSFGVNVALEIAKLLEAEGHKGVVYCLDSSPDALKSQIKAYIGDLTESELQNVVLVHMFQLMTKHEGIEMKEELEKVYNWSDKIEICLNKLRGLVHFSIEHRRTILESAYKRIMLAKAYEPEFTLQSEVILMKGIPHPEVANLTDDYNLSKFTNQPVKVFHIESDHTSAPYDCRVSNIINKMLDPDLLEEFKRKNLCEYYHL